jgi:hypothetical protein
MAAGHGLEAAAGMWAAGDRASWPDPRRDELTEGAPR